MQSCKCKGLKPPAGEDAVLNLLSVEFTQTDEPAGIVTLHFSGGGALRLEVECLEAELADLGPTWTTGCLSRPCRWRINRRYAAPRLICLLAG